MASNIQRTSPNYWKLKNAFLVPEIVNLGVKTSVKGVDILSLIPEIRINESIDAGSMLTGWVEVYDSIGLLEGMPLRGEERLTLVVEDAMKNLRVWDLFIVKIDNVTVSKVNDMLIYKLHFMSFQSFIANNLVITKPYKQMTVTEIVSHLFEETYTPRGVTFPEYVPPSDADQGEIFDTTKKGLITEASEGFVRLVIPRMTTTQAMNFLARRAYSATSPSAAFRFFESSTAFHFVTDEYLYKTAQQLQKIFYMTAIDNIVRDGSEFIHEFNNLEQITNSSRVDTMDDIHGGAYNNRVIELDTVQRIANLHQAPYNYWSNRNRYTTVSNNDRLVDRHTVEFMEVYSRPDNARTFTIVKDYDDWEEIAAFQNRGQTHYKDIVQNSVPYRKHLNSITVEAVGPPRVDITVGDVINLSITEINASGGTSKNIQLTGDYIVKNLTRSFIAEEGRNHYTLVKANWAEDSTNNSLTSLDRINNWARDLGNIFK